MLAAPLFAGLAMSKVREIGLRPSMLCLSLTHLVRDCSRSVNHPRGHGLPRPFLHVPALFSRCDDVRFAEGVVCCMVGAMVDPDLFGGEVSVAILARRIAGDFRIVTKQGNPDLNWNSCYLNNFMQQALTPRHIFAYFRGYIRL